MAVVRRGFRLPSLRRCRTAVSFDCNPCFACISPRQGPPIPVSSSVLPVRVSIGDVTLFVDVDGAALVPDGHSMRERPTLVMLHGGPGLDHTPFKQPIFSPLKEVAQVVYYDHRGNGRSDRSSPDKWNLNTWADDVVALCSALGIEHPIVFGGSFGGFVALNYAVRHPEHPAKLILSSTAAHIDWNAPWRCSNA